MKSERGYTGIAFLVIVGVWVAALGGWIANVVKLVGSDFTQFSGMEIARIIGVIVAPLGAVLGYL
jgi:hypothetical protein